MALKRKTRVWIARIMAIIMVFCLPVQAGIPVSAEESGEDLVSKLDLSGDKLEFSASNMYAIVADSGNGKAVNTKVKNWVEDSIVVDGTYNKDTNMLTEDTAGFKITTCEDSEQAGLQSDEIKVMITCNIGGETCQLRMEADKGYAFADPDANRIIGDSEKYIIKKTSENTGTIQAVSDKTYATVDKGDKAILRFTEKNGDNAEQFYFAENPKLLNTEYTIEHAKSGKYVKTYEAVEDKGNCEPLTVDGNKGEEDTIFKKAVFTKNTSDAVGTVPVVGFVSKKYGKGIMSA